MSFLFTFLPWIAYAVLGGHTAASQQRATLAALAITVLVIAYKRRKGSALDALIVETGSAVFFAVIAIVAFTAPHSGALTYAAPLSGATLAVIAWGSLAERRGRHRHPHRLPDPRVRRPDDLHRPVRQDRPGQGTAARRPRPSGYARPAVTPRAFIASRSTRGGCSGRARQGGESPTAAR